MPFNITPNYNEQQNQLAKGLFSGAKDFSSKIPTREQINTIPTSPVKTTIANTTPLVKYPNLNASIN